MSLTTIAAPFTHEPVKLDDADEQRVLTTLKIIYEGGSLDGKVANFPTRDLSCVVVGIHQGYWHFFETYKRTVSINIRNRRTIFRSSGSLTSKTSKPDNSDGWKKLLAALRIRKLKAIVI